MRVVKAKRAEKKRYKRDNPLYGTIRHQGVNLIIEDISHKMKNDESPRFRVLAPDDMTFPGDTFFIYSRTLERLVKTLKRFGELVPKI